MNTIYGVIEIILEDGRKKIDFNKSKFYSLGHLLKFLNNRDLLFNLCKY